MPERLLSEKRDALFPEGFGKILKPGRKLASIDEVLDCIHAHADDVLRHGVVLLEREDVCDDVTWEIPESLEPVSTGFAPQLLHAHPIDIGMVAPYVNSTPTVFASKDTQQASLRHFGRTPEARSVLGSFPALAPLIDPRDLLLSTQRERHKNRLVMLVRSAIGASGPLTASEMANITDGVYRQERGSFGAEIYANIVAPALQTSQECVAEDLLTVDWKQMFACRFRKGLPHARSALGEAKRTTPLYGLRYKLVTPE